MGIPGRRNGMSKGIEKWPGCVENYQELVMLEHQVMGRQEVMRDKAGQESRPGCGVPYTPCNLSCMLLEAIKKF